MHDHDCPGLAECEVHTRVHVTRMPKWWPPSPPSRPWRVYAWDRDWASPVVVGRFDEHDVAVRFANRIAASGASDMT